jgi:hypothetical protein
MLLFSSVADKIKEIMVMLTFLLVDGIIIVYIYVK